MSGGTGNRREFLAAVGAGGLAGLAGCSLLGDEAPDSEGNGVPTPRPCEPSRVSLDTTRPGGAWPSPRADVANTGANLDVQGPDLDRFPELESTNVLTVRGVLSPVTVGFGRLYVAGDDSCYALDGETGGTDWSLPIDGTVLDVTASSVYVIDAGGTVWGIDRRSGTPRWRVDPDSPIQSMLVRPEGTVLIATEDGMLSGIDPRCGASRFRSPTAVSGSPSLGYRDGTVYVAGGATLAAHSPTDGQERWRYELPDLDTIDTGPSIAGSTVVVAEGGGRVSAVDAADRERRWTIGPAEGPIGYGPPSLGSEYVYYLDRDDTYRSVRLSDGTLEWTYTVNAGSRLSPTRVAGAVLVVSRERVHSLDAATGKLRATAETPSERWEGWPVVTADAIYLRAGFEATSWLYRLSMPAGTATPSA